MEEGTSPEFLQLLRKVIWSIRSTHICVFVFGIMLANFHMWGIMFLLRAVVYMLVRKVSPRGPMCFRETLFRHVGAFLLLFPPYGRHFSRCGPFCYFVLLIGGLFSMWGAFLGLPPPPHTTKISASTHGPCHDINLNVKFVENVFARAA